MGPGAAGGEVAAWEADDAPDENGYERFLAAHGAGLLPRPGRQKMEEACLLLVRAYAASPGQVEWGDVQRALEAALSAWGAGADGIPARPPREWLVEVAADYRRSAAVRVLAHTREGAERLAAELVGQGKVALAGEGRLLPGSEEAEARPAGAGPG